MDMHYLKINYRYRYNILSLYCYELHLQEQLIMTLALKTPSFVKITGLAFYLSLHCVQLNTPDMYLSMSMYCWGLLYIV